MNAPQLYLASRSPRRKSLLKQAGIRFRVYVPQEEELAAPRTHEKSGPVRIVKEIAQSKAQAAWKELSGRGVERGMILSADTLVFQDGRVLGKPKSKAEARRMLAQLSGRWHLVCTGVTCLVFEGRKKRIRTIAVKSRVKFFTLSASLIDWYIATGEPMDKAGSYGAQAHGSQFIKRFSGSYTNVVGLPLGEAIALMESMGGARSRTVQKGRA